MTVDLTFGRNQRYGFAAGVGLLLALGLGLWANLLTDEPHVAAPVIGTVLLVLAGLLLRVRHRIFAPRSLTFDARGIRHGAVDRRAFQVEWSELAQARVSYARKPGPLRSPLTWGGVTADADPGQDPRAHWGISTFVRLDLVPADPGFLDRHRNLAVFKRYTGRPGEAPRSTWADDIGEQQAILRIPFGDMPQVASEVDAGLRRFAGERYHPPVNEGLAWGFRYS